MRILFISNYSDLYGANRSMLTIIEHFKKKGDEVALILPKHGNIEEALVQKNIKYVVISCFTQLYYYKPQLKYLALPFLAMHTYFQLSKIERYVCSFEPDLIYSNTSAENLGIKIAKRNGIKHISHIREFMDLDHDARFVYGRKKKKDYINQSDGVIYVSNSVANHVNLGEPLKTWQKVIYNGVNTIDFAFSDKELPKELNLGIVGILDPEKGQDVAIRILPTILKIYPNARLHVWGDKVGKYKNSLYKMVDQMQISDNVVFHGFEKNPNVIYKDMDILMMCSRSEGFGRVTIEAMQRAIPVLGYNSGGTSELVKNGINGYLFSSAEECVSGLQQLLCSKGEYNKVRRGAFDDSRANYSVELYCSRVENFVNFIMNNKIK